jgi:hypothetical protein
MSLVLMESFRMGDHANKWSASSLVNLSNQTASPATPGGTYASGPSGAAGTLTCATGAAAELYAHIRFKEPSNQVFRFAFQGDGGGTTHITVLTTAAGLIEVRRGTSGSTIIATGTTVLPTNTWHQIKIRCIIADVGGVVQVRLNGSLADEINFSGDTKNGGTGTTIDAISMPIPNPGAGQRLHIADLWCNNALGAVNNAWPGDFTIRALVPNGNGNYSQLMGSDGNQVDNYLQVDEVPVSTADYNFSAVVGEKDSYAMEDAPVGLTGIAGLQGCVLAQKSDASAASQELLLRHTATDANGATHALTTGWVTYRDEFDVDPITTAAWTLSNVNSLEAGMEVA